MPLSTYASTHRAIHPPRMTRSETRAGNRHPAAAGPLPISGGTWENNGPYAPHSLASPPLRTPPVQRRITPVRAGVRVGGSGVGHLRPGQHSRCAAGKHLVPGRRGRRRRRRPTMPGAPEMHSISSMYSTIGGDRVPPPLPAVFRNQQRMLGNPATGLPGRVSQISPGIQQTLTTRSRDHPERVTSAVRLCRDGPDPGTAGCRFPTESDGHLRIAPHGLAPTGPHGYECPRHGVVASWP